jgi:hypothetical protein
MAKLYRGEKGRPKAKARDEGCINGPMIACRKELRNVDVIGSPKEDLLEKIQTGRVFA